MSQPIPSYALKSATVARSPFRRPIHCRRTAAEAATRSLPCCSRRTRSLRCPSAQSQQQSPRSTGSRPQPRDPPLLTRASSKEDGPSGSGLTVDGAPEFDVWKEKPGWCQPWSILLTGVSIVSGSFLVFHSKWFTGVVAVPIGLWWYLFLVLYPQEYKDYRIQEMAGQGGGDLSAEAMKSERS